MSTIEDRLSALERAVDELRSMIANSGPTRAAKTPKPEGVSDTVWRDFCALRQAKKAPVTASAIARISREAGRAGMSIQQALEMCCARGWTGFQASWVPDDERQKAAADSWRNTRSGIESMGIELGLGLWDEAEFQRGDGESFAAYRSKVENLYNRQGNA